MLVRRHGMILRFLTDVPNYSRSHSHSCSRSRSRSDGAVMMFRESASNGAVTWRFSSSSTLTRTSTAVSEGRMQDEGGHERMRGRIRQWLSSMFLPANYPKSVHASYASFHFWQAIETFTTSTSGVLCNQALLVSLGLSASSGTAAAAVAIQWVLKDGLGEITKLFFTRRYAPSFDSHPLQWKLSSEILHEVGSTIFLLTVLAPPSFFLGLASIGNVARSISWVTWGSTHMWFSKHFALGRNIGDISAKADSQMSFAHVLGMIVGAGLLSISHTPGFLFSCFAILAPAHLLATVSLIRTARFPFLNESSGMLVASEFARLGAVPTPLQLNKLMSFTGTCPLWKQITYGHEIASRPDVVPRVLIGESMRGELESATPEAIQSISDLIAANNFLILPYAPNGLLAAASPDSRGLGFRGLFARMRAAWDGFCARKVPTYRVILQKHASPADIARSLLVISQLQHDANIGPAGSFAAVANGATQQWLDRLQSTCDAAQTLFLEFEKQLETAGFRVSDMHFADRGKRYMILEENAHTSEAAEQTK
ncbi:conserved mitochondrial DUF647 domain-containing protein [Andalucia godoyi]|uniref:Conserved mitochondrial DUF647 domain-containing protein n=1 Tax=Andalucia godoyi TaxID=505711 RepID=A0A8K0AJE4_ANDGO|nr:conserved mitochondrial DUF647 domain-containing protein [Andalucia godoyi]|eukprot:ANDGO_00626.mRNA.1 conserved mitochondrial DUF647 domain-containing protein